MITGTIKYTLTATALVALSTAGLSAASAKTYESRSATVEYADLDLTNGKGRARLNGRIKAAVNKVCGRYAGLGARASRQHRTCVIDANESVRRAKEVAVMDAETAKPKQTAFAIGG